MIGRGLAEGRRNNVNLFTEFDKELLHVSGPDRRSRPDPHNLETSLLVSSCLNPGSGKPHSHELPLLPPRTPMM